MDWTEHHQFEEKVLELMRRTSDGLGDRAILTVEPPQIPHGYIVALSPTRPSAARLIVHIEAPDQLDLDVGAGGHFEFRRRRGETESEFLQRFQELVEGVIRGAVRETYWQRGSHVTKSRGQILLSSGTVFGFNWRTLVWGLARGTKHVKQYVPF